MKSDRKYTGFEIAIVGIACRVPGAANWREYWKNLANGVECTHFMPREQLIALGIDEDTIGNKSYIPVISGLKDKDAFDAAFFDYTPLEAGLMNPVHRWIHECVWEALEDAGYNSESSKGPIGIYLGAGEDSNWKLYSRLKNHSVGMDSFSLNTINNKDFLASLLSYKLNLRGPVVAINTTCSTSLVAVNMACRSLLFGEANVMLAGGITLNSEVQLGYFYQDGMIFSKDGHCRTFDKDASGTVGSEGAGVVVLRRLQDAIRDNDHIYAVIKGSAVNNDGSGKVGFAAVSVEGQVDCIRKAHKFARVTPQSITYVEAHGTATRLGDPIEVEALNIAFDHDKHHTCAIGSVKTNIGHLDTAAGVAGLIKTALSLQHRQLPASLHYREANPEIDFGAGPFYVNTSLREWRRSGDGPLRAGVSSLGIGGTNAHAVLEEAPEREAGDAGRASHLLTVSARTEQSVIRYLDRLQSFLEEEEGVNLADMSYTLQTCRKEFAYRQSTAFRDREELLGLLRSGRLKEGIGRTPDRRPGVVFMFSGQGAQYGGMGRDLYGQEPVFRAVMEEGLSLLESMSGESFREVLYGREQEKINETRYTQPLLFLVEYALAMLLRSMGIEAQYMIGHSIGEYVAACLSGVFSFEDGLRMVMHRGALMNGVERGAMLSIPLTATAVQVYMNGRLSLAAENGPEQVVLSGDLEAIEALMAQLDKEGIGYVKLHTSHAFHSWMQEGILEPFSRALEQVRFGEIKGSFISNETGRFIENGEAGSPAYWVRHMRGTVRFSQGLQTLLEQEGPLVFVEVGPGRSLTGLLRQQEKASGMLPVQLMRTVKEKQDDQHHLTESIGRLWSQGVNVDWSGYYGKERRNKIPLPTYAFEPVIYPVEVDPFEGRLLSGLHDRTTNQGLKDWIYYPSWKRALRREEEAPEGQRCYLLFSSGEPCALLQQELRAAGQEVIVADMGTEYLRLGTDSYILDPCDPLQYERLVEELLEEGMEVTDIVYGWGIGVQELELEEEDQGLCRCYFGLVYVVQSLLEAGRLKDKRITVLTCELHRVMGIERGSHVQSLLLGLVNVLPQEYSVTCCNIDLPAAAPGEQYQPELVREIRNNVGGQQRIVALRHGHRWVQDFQRNTLEVETPAGALREGGVYLVTGGLGNVGFVLSSHLLKNYKATVLVTGRQEPGGLTADRLSRYEALRAMGGRVRYFKADVTEQEDWEEAIAEMERWAGRIDGVIHTAGVLDDDHFELVEDMTVDRTIRMLGPKVKGIGQLYRTFAGRRPDFVWITSSLSTVLGGLGFGSYASANLYMDHFILSKARELTGWRTIGLGGLVFTKEDIRKESGPARFSLKPEELTALFEWSLGQKDSPVLIQSVEDLSQRIYRVYEQKKEAYLDDDRQQKQEEREKVERPRLSTGYAAPEGETETRLVQLFESFFGIAGIGTADSFFELGGDSLKAMMLLKRIKNEFDLNLTLTDFFQNDKIAKLAEFISGLKSMAASSARSSKIVI